MTVFLLVLSPLMWLAAVLSLALTDLLWHLCGAGSQPAAASQAAPLPPSAPVVIPNWNGRDLLERYLPSVIAALSHNPENEIIVVDNGSADGSAEFVRNAFPDVKGLALDRKGTALKPS